MAHPDIMDDRPAIAELERVAQQPRGGEIVAVVIAPGDADAMFGDDYIADRDHRARAFAADRAHLRPALGRRSEQCVRPAVIARDERDEHPVDIPRPHRVRLRRQHEPADDAGEVDRDQRILGHALGIIPQPHVPGPRIAVPVAPLDRQHRAVDRIERAHPARAPAEREPAIAEIARGLISEQRMIPAILGFPDQPGEIVGAIEDAIDAQRIGRDRRHRRHHRPREVDRPETRVEALDHPSRLMPPFAAQPIAHIPFALIVRASEKKSVRPEPVEGRPQLTGTGRPSTSSGRTVERGPVPTSRGPYPPASSSAAFTARATWRLDRASAAGAVSAAALTVIATRTSRAPAAPAGAIAPLAVGMNNSGPRSPTQ